MNESCRLIAFIVGFYELCVVFFFCLDVCVCGVGISFCSFSQCFFLFLLTSLDLHPHHSDPSQYTFYVDSTRRIFFRDCSFSFQRKVSLASWSPSFLPWLATHPINIPKHATHHHQRISISIHINNTIMMLRTLTFTAALILSLASAERFNEIKVNVYWHTRELNWTELNWTEHDWLVTPPITSPRCAMQHHRNPIHACMHAFIHI